MRDLLGLNAGIDAMGLEEHLVDQEQQLQNLQEQLADLMQGSALGASTLTELLQQQLECLAQGVFCLGTTTQWKCLVIYAQSCIGSRTGSGHLSGSPQPSRPLRCSLPTSRITTSPTALHALQG